MYGCELVSEESWGLKNWCFWPVVLEKTLESLSPCKEIQPAHSKGAQSWVFIRRTDAKAETPILWPPHGKSWLIGKDPDAGRDWGQGEKGTTEDEMAGWHHRLDAHGFGWTLGVGDGQGGLACYNSWGGKQSDTTEWLNWTDWVCTGAHTFLFNNLDSCTQQLIPHFYLNIRISKLFCTKPSLNILPPNNYFFLIAPQLIKCRLQFFQLLSQKPYNHPNSTLFLTPNMWSISKFFWLYLQNMS